MSDKSGKVLDALYGEVRFTSDLTELIQSSPVQRLRHVRLSNIDSTAMPGIAGVSRYEHSLGVAYLAGCVSMSAKDSMRDRQVVMAAGLLHDTAITPFGHLIEEAFKYGGTFDHEVRLRQVFGLEAGLGGPHFQVLGRENELLNWAHKYCQGEPHNTLQDILSSIAGQGRLGRLIKGSIDLDNLDNLCRIAFHMGLSVDKSLPIRVARGMSIPGDGALIFSAAAASCVDEWLKLRREVYRRLMLSREDFVSKMMLIYAAMVAHEAGILKTDDWKLTDGGFTHHILDKGPTSARETVLRWLRGDSWELADLLWVEGQLPLYSELKALSTELSGALGRHCFLYGITDKSTRKVSLRIEDGTEVSFGQPPTKWLLGVASRVRKPFSQRETATIRTIVADRLASRLEDVEARLLPKLDLYG